MRASSRVALHRGKDDEIVAVLAVSRCVHCHRRTELRARLG